MFLLFLIESPALAAGTKTESWRSSRADCVSDRIRSEKERKRSEDEERRKKAIPLVMKGENKISVSSSQSCTWIDEEEINTYIYIQ